MNLLITGANRGLGFSLVKIGLRNGHHVFAGVRNTDEIVTKQLIDLQKDFKGQLEIVQLDVTSEDSVMNAVSKVKDSKGKLDAIINNAGMLNEREKTIEELDIEQFKLALDINTLGPIRVIKHFLPLLEQGEKQSIINISSDAASLTNAYSGDYPYGISKVGINMLSKKLQIYLKDKDIQVLAVHPGWMKTDMGGNNAPTDPVDSAKGIYNMIERKIDLNSTSAFVDYKGKSMEI